jgi:hypothetical protein
MSQRVILRLAVYCQSVCLSANPLEDHDQRFFVTESLLPLSLCNIPSGGKLGLSLMNRLRLCQMYVNFFVHFEERNKIIRM